MKSIQVSTRMSREDIDLVAKFARASHMTPSAMLRRLVLERLEQIALAQTSQCLPQAQGNQCLPQAQENQCLPQAQEGEIK